MDVGSSPMEDITSYDVIINELYTKSQLSNILLSRPSGVTRCCSNLHDDIYKVHAHYCLMTRPLGAILVELFMGIRQLQVSGCCKHDNPALGGYRWYTYKGEKSSNSQFWAEQIDPVSATIMTRHHLFLGLTYWSSAQCRFLFVAWFLFRRISISNGVQTE